jgi:hydroxymethylbilane synthase
LAEIGASDSGIFRIGTRGSALALYQANRVKARLEAAAPELDYELVVVSTQGDRDKSTPLTIIGGQGVFAKELQRALVDNEIDCAVHSLKDLPTILPDPTTLAAVLERDDPRDVLISADRSSLSDLSAGSKVGTSSRRRMAQVLSVRPDIQTIELRGNVDTRMAKVLDTTGEYDAAVLAAAGVLRMGWQDQITEYLSLDDFTPPPGQAALGVECRRADERALDLLSRISDEETEFLTGVERAFLRALGGGCRSPIGAHGSLVNGGAVTLRTMVASEDLQRIEKRTTTIARDKANDVASELAREMLYLVSP